MKKVILIVFVIILYGCTSLGHKQFYDQVSPSKYPTTQKVMVFEYNNVDLQEIYELLFDDFLIIGKSAFNGPYEDPKKSVRFAKSIGADIFIATSQFKGTRTSFINLSIPSISTTYISGYSGSGSFYGTATTYGTETTTLPIRVNRYDQDGMYLKNVNNVIPLWERTKNQYIKTASSDLGGRWKNESYEIELYQSGNQMVAFITKVMKGSTSWTSGQLKMIFGVDSNVGIYLMGDKSPIPSEIKVNKFGHLEVNLLTNNETFSFERSF